MKYLFFVLVLFSSCATAKLEPNKWYKIGPCTHFEYEAYPDVTNKTRILSTPQQHHYNSSYLAYPPTEKMKEKDYALRCYLGN